MSPWSRLTIIVGGGVALLIYGCSREADPQTNPTSEPSKATSNADALLPAVTESHDINDVLEEWSKGDRDAAVHILLNLYDAEAPPERFRPYDVNEEQFIALPANERDARREAMLKTFQTLREFVRELERRVEAASTSGDLQSAEKMLLAMKQLGAANTGSAVTRVADLVGQAIRERAESRLSELFQKQGTPSE